MNYDQHLREMAAHIVWMQSIPGARDYARERLKELRKVHPMYEALLPMVREAMTAPVVCPVLPASSASPSAPSAGSMLASTGASGRAA